MRGGGGGKIPWPWQLAPTTGNLTNSDLKSYLIILNLKFQCTDIRMVEVPAFTFSLYGKGSRPTTVALEVSSQAQKIL